MVFLLIWIIVIYNLFSFSDFGFQIYFSRTRFIIHKNPAQIKS